MLTRKSNGLVQEAGASLRRRHVALVCALALLTIVMAGTRADAAPIVFRYSGGVWSHGFHAGWHHYWGGPSIGFYYAPAPAYVVAGYEAPSYYAGPDFWYSNPSFGLSVNIGGGGYAGGYYSGRGGHYVGGGARFGKGFHPLGRLFDRGRYRGRHDR